MESVLAAGQVVTTLVDVCERLRKAKERHKDHAETIQRAYDEVHHTTKVVKLVKKKEELHGPQLLSALKTLHDDAAALKRFVNAMDVSRGSVAGWAHQLANGTTERSRLDGCLERLSRSKQTLALEIQLCHVGLTQQTLDVNLEVVEQINQAVRKTLGKNLVIASFVHAQFDQSGSVSSNGMIRLSATQYANLQMLLMSLRYPELGHGPIDRDQIYRFIEYNTSTGNSTLIDAPIGEDTSKHINVLRISHNRSEDGSLHIAHPQSESAARIFLEHQAKQLAAERRHERDVERERHERDVERERVRGGKEEEKREKEKERKKHRKRNSLW